jgi:hypothetical protein
MEAVLACDLERIEVNTRIFMTRKADKPELAGLARIHERRIGALIVKNAVRIFKAQNLVMLDEVDAIGFQPFQ